MAMVLPLLLILFVPFDGLDIELVELPVNFKLLDEALLFESMSYVLQ